MRTLVLKPEYHIANSIGELIFRLLLSGLVLWILMFILLNFGEFYNEFQTDWYKVKNPFIAGNWYQFWRRLPEFVGPIILMFLPLAWLLLIIHLKKKSYAHQTYELNDEGIEDRFEYIHHSKHSIRYSDIKEVILERGILQHRYGLGTVCLITNATRPIPGIYIGNIREYQEVYDFIKEKIGNNRYKPL